MENFQMFKKDLEKADKLEIKLQHPLEKQENSRETSTSASMTMLNFDCVDHN